MTSKKFLSVITALLLAAAAFTVMAQEPAGPVKESAPAAKQQDRKSTTETTPAASEPGRLQRPSEDDAAKLLYLKNYVEDYRLGPEDVINVDVFGPQVQIYSQQNIIVPPDGKINYKLIGQINVRGRSVQDVEKEITEKLNEYIIDPKVTVQLVQSHSMKYIVDGDVAKPAIYEMTRRMTIREAIVNAGGILATGDKGNVQIARSMPSGGSSILKVNFHELEKGKALDEPIAPGDMIFVPGNRFKTIQKWTTVLQSVTWLPMIGFGRF